MKRIYVLRDPRDGSIRYAGATSYSLSKRLSLHVTMSRKTTTRCAAWIRDLVACGKRPTIHLHEEADDWQAAERSLIASMRSAGVALLNQTDGGMGCLGCRPEPSARAKRSATLKQRYANDPAQMASRQELARMAARSQNGRKAASERMTRIWAERRAQC